MSKNEFIAQQGARVLYPGSSGMLYSALQFQPRLTGLIVLVGAVTGSAELFMVLGAVKWWNVLAPRWNPFEMLYNRILAPSCGVSLMPAAAPRLFAQAIAGSLLLSIAVLLSMGSNTGALLLEGAFLLAVAGVVFGRYCFGAAVYHALNARGVFGVSRVTR